MTVLTAQNLDHYARKYYLSGESEKNRRIEQIGQRKVADLVTALCRSDGRTLEMGYGDGTMAPYLADYFDDLTFLEGSPLLAKEASGRGYRVVESMFEAHHPQDKYDTVLCLHVLDHVTDPRGLIDRMAGWVSPDATLIVVVPNALSYHRQLAVTMGLAESPEELGESDREVGHYRVYSPDTMHDLFDGSMWHIETLSGYQLKCVPNRDMYHLGNEKLAGLYDIPVGPECAANLVVKAHLR